MDFLTHSEGTHALVRAAISVISGPLPLISAALALTSAALVLTSATLAFKSAAPIMSATIAVVSAVPAICGDFPPHIEGHSKLKFCASALAACRTEPRSPLFSKKGF